MKVLTIKLTNSLPSVNIFFLEIPLPLYLNIASPKHINERAVSPCAENLNTGLAWQLMVQNDTVIEWSGFLIISIII